MFEVRSINGQASPLLDGILRTLKMKQFFFAILCGHGTNKTVKKRKTRVGTLKETFEEFMRSGVQKETSTLRRKE